jgi:hypothetical protein
MAAAMHSRSRRVETNPKVCKPALRSTDSKEWAFRGRAPSSRACEGARSHLVDDPVRSSIRPFCSTLRCRTGTASTCFCACRNRKVDTPVPRADGSRLDSKDRVLGLRQRCRRLTGPQAVLRSRKCLATACARYCGVVPDSVKRCASSCRDLDRFDPPHFNAAWWPPRGAGRDDADLTVRGNSHSSSSLGRSMPARWLSVADTLGAGCLEGVGAAVHVAPR